MALAIYDRGICECGYHSSLTSDPANQFEIQDRTCNVCGALARYSRIQQENDAEVERRAGGDKMPAKAPRPSDGRRTGVRHVPAA